MTSDTGAVARIVDGLREIWLECIGDMENEAKKGNAAMADFHAARATIARECLAVAEAQR